MNGGGANETGKNQIRKAEIHSGSDVFHAFGLAGYGGDALCSGCCNDAVVYVMGLVSR